MKTFKVRVRITTYAETEVEAENSDEAFFEAEKMDGGDFTPDIFSGHFEIVDVSEINP